MLFDALVYFTLFNCKETPPQLIPLLSGQVSVYMGDEYFSATSWIFHSYLNAEMTLNSPLTIIKNFSSHISIKLQHNSANRA